MPRAPSISQMARFQGRLWTPDLVRPALWLDAADQSTITIATGVSEWRDKSNNGRHFTQAVTGSQLALSIGTFNGQNCLRFDGSNDVLNRVPEAWAYEYPIAHFCVFRALSFTPAYSALVEFYTSNTGTAAGWTSLIKSNGRSSVYVAHNAGQANYDGTGALSYVTNTPYVWSSNVGNGFINSWGNGRVDGVVSGTWTGRTNLGTSTPTMGASALFSRYTNWDIAEQIVLNSSSVGTISAAVRQLIEGYLAWKWGVPLTASHPFANRPPLIGD